MDKYNLTRQDIIRIYFLMEKLIEIFHDNNRAYNEKIISEFIDEYYPIIYDLYYRIIWNVLTTEERKNILGDDYIDKLDNNG